MRHTEREAETQAEGEAGSLQGARRETRSQDPGVTLDAQPLSHRVPKQLFQIEYIGRIMLDRLDFI